MNPNYQKMVNLAADMSLVMEPFLSRLKCTGTSQENIEEFYTKGIDICIGCALENTDPSNSLKDLFENVNGSTENALDGSDE